MTRSMWGPCSFLGSRCPWAIGTLRQDMSQDVTAMAEVVKYLQSRGLVVGDNLSLIIENWDVQSLCFVNLVVVYFLNDVYMILLNTSQFNIITGQ